MHTWALPDARRIRFDFTGRVGRASHHSRSPLFRGVRVLSLWQFARAEAAADIVSRRHTVARTFTLLFGGGRSAPLHSVARFFLAHFDIYRCACTRVRVRACTYLCACTQVNLLFFPLLFSLLAYLSPAVRYGKRAVICWRVRCFCARAPPVVRAGVGRAAFPAHSALGLSPSRVVAVTFHSPLVTRTFPHHVGAFFVRKSVFVAVGGNEARDCVSAHRT